MPVNSRIRYINPSTKVAYFSKSSVVAAFRVDTLSCALFNASYASFSAFNR